MKLECDAPWAVDMDRIALWAPAPQLVEGESRHIEIRRFGSGLKSVEHDQSTGLKIRTDSPALTGLEQLTETLVPPRSYHNLNVNPGLSFVNL